jgi:2-hydroxychromene-2-carboxylate isomerase
VSLEVVDGSPTPPAAEAVFYYDLGNPDAYLIAERIRAELPLLCDWEPVHAAALGLTCSEPPDADELGARVAALELLPLRLPARWPPDTELAMRVAAYAKGGGKSIAYSLAAFRQAFAGGRDLGDEGTVLLAAAACEMHPTAVLKGAATRATAASLRRAGERARAAGVTALPALTIGDTTTCGPRALDDALAVVAQWPPA